MDNGVLGRGKLYPDAEQMIVISTYCRGQVPREVRFLVRRAALAYERLGTP